MSTCEIQFDMPYGWSTCPYPAEIVYGRKCEACGSQGRRVACRACYALMLEGSPPSDWACRDCWAKGQLTVSEAIPLVGVA